MAFISSLTSLFAPSCTSNDQNQFDLTTHPNLSKKVIADIYPLMNVDTGHSPMVHPIKSVETITHSLMDVDTEGEYQTNGCYLHNCIELYTGPSKRLPDTMFSFSLPKEGHSQAMSLSMVEETIVTPVIVSSADRKSTRLNSSHRP